MIRKLILILALCAPAFGQSWSGVLATSRAINWTGAGLPATLPDSETTANPWTPPVRTQCGSTVNPTGTSADAAAINTALQACTSGHYVLLGAGTFEIESGASGTGICYGSFPCVNFYSVSGVTLRGSGANSTKIVLASGNTTITWGISNSPGSGTWSGASAGATSFTFSGSGLANGDLMVLNQCDTGFSGSSCTGSFTDNGGLAVCGAIGGICSQQTRSDTNRNQRQIVRVTNVSGSTVTFTPGLYLANWASGQSPTISYAAYPYGDGLEDLTVDATASTYTHPVEAYNTYGSWIKGVRIVGAGPGGSNYIHDLKNFLVTNSYLEAYSYASSSDTVFNQMGNASDVLELNNIIHDGQLWNGTGGNTGDVLGYNFARDSETSYYQLADYDHEPGGSMMLHEGNQSGLFLGDNTWGSQDLETLFRNYFSGGDGPYTTAPNPRVITINESVRFENIIGNVLGGPLVSTYQVSSGDSGYVYQFTSGDSLDLSSSMRWGNYDSVTEAVRWCGNSSSPGWSSTCSSTSEVPVTLTGNAAPFENPVPSSTALPCSFFLTGFSSTTCTAFPTGGTGLSWWKVCTSWSSFPTTCAGTQTPPFPAIGPDVTGGPYMGGYAYDIPASLAFQHLPIDTNYQNSYSIIGSSWTGGVETLTISGLPAGSHIIGGFQVTGTSGCNTSGAPGGSTEFVMTTSSPVPSSATATTVSYPVASNPGTCAGGHFLFPDVRQFDERVYETDSTVVVPPPAPFPMLAQAH